MPKELQIFQQKDTCVISVQTDNRGEVGDVGMLRQYAEEVGSQFSLQWISQVPQLTWKSVGSTIPLKQANRHPFATLLANAKH